MKKGYVSFHPSYLDTPAIERWEWEKPAPVWKYIAVAERVAAFLMLVAVLPLLLAIVSGIVLLSRRSPLVAHKRVGQHGRELWVLKLRTMWGSGARSQNKHFLAERVSNDGEPGPKKLGDPRVTSRFAAFCRKYSIDELPQLWHVIRGDMSLVGPRPLTSKELTKYYGPDTLRVLAVKPGLSGLWQVNGRSSLNLCQRKRLDLFMINNWSLRLYLYVLQATLPTVLSGRNAW